METDMETEIDTAILYLKAIRLISRELDKNQQTLILKNIQRLVRDMDELILCHRDDLFHEDDNLSEMNLQPRSENFTDKTLDVFLPCMLLYQLYMTKTN